jgi:glycosyltransferase involved in cell wall biosynthesis
MLTTSSANRTHISVVTPVYGCSSCLHKLYDRLVQSLSFISEDFEIIMVNDASPDGAWQLIEELSDKDSRVKGINFSRNFGQHHAITAGLDHATGIWVVVMDCDLQDQPEEIPKLYAAAQKGHEVVFGRRKVRQDKFLKKMSSALFYRVLMYFTEQEFDPAVANFSIISQRVVHALKSLREQNRNYPLSVLWLGFNTAYIDIEHASRFEGESSYTFKKLVYFAYDIIIAHSNKPLRLSIKLGFIMSLASIFYATYLVFRFFVEGVPVAGWTSTMVSIYFVGGVLMANMGIMGLYIGKTFNEGKGRPIYVIGSTRNLNAPGKMSD